MAADVTYYRTPAWQTTLIVLLAAGGLALFVLFLLTHARYRTVEEARAALGAEMPELRKAKAGLEAEIKAAVEQTEERRRRLTELNESEKQQQDDVARMGNEIQRTLAETDEAYKKRQARYADLMQQAPTARKELDTEETRRFAQEHEFDERRQQLRAQIEALQQELEGVRKRIRGDNKTRDDRIAQLEARVRQITSQLDLSNRSLRSDGEILASAAADGYVVINRGHRHNLRNGTSFHVYTKRAGRVVEKGYIQVVRVEDDLSTCRVQAEYDLNDPLLPGDQLHNPVYDPEKRVVFAIRGDFKRFSRDELARLITDAGGVVDNSLGTGTDYLVAGENSGKDLESATRLGMTVLSEDQLLEFVRTRPRWRSQETFDFVVKAAQAGKAIALVGRFTKAREGVVSDWLKRQGARVSGGIDEKTAIIIVGEGALAEMGQARAQGIPVVDQTQFSHLTAADLKKP